MRQIGVLLTLFGVAVCHSTIDTPYGAFFTDPISPEDREWLAQNTGLTRMTYPPGFRFLYVSQDGRIQNGSRPAHGHWIEVVASPLTTRTAHYTAAMEVGKMLRLSPAHVFNNIASSPGAGLGVFTAQEKLVVYPEYYQLKDTPQCKKRCDGACRKTCTFDGRKWQNVAGIGGKRALVLVENFMCSPHHDPYGHRDNILVHEFSHLVEARGLNKTEKSMVITAYHNSKTHELWNPKSYAQANHAEYFAEATGAFFYVNLQGTTGGMTRCPIGSAFRKCRDEIEVRRMLKDHDPQLFNVLVNTYTNGHPWADSNLRVCDTLGNDTTPK